MGAGGWVRATGNLQRCWRALAHNKGVPAGGGEGAKAGAVGVDELVAALVALVPPEPRKQGGPFLLAVDHCFAIRGQGTVLTGTVLAGSLQASLLLTAIS